MVKPRTPPPQEREAIKRNLSETTLRHGGMFNLTEFRGTVPSQLGNVEIQEQRCLNRLRTLQDPLSKYEYLASLRSSNTALFYRLVLDHLYECTPIIYTPTVGAACQQWSAIYANRVDALYLNANDSECLSTWCSTNARVWALAEGHIAKVLANFEAPENIDISVVTDGSRILGLGDLGIGGIGIPIGKLSLYIACAGISPERTLPVVLDLGTNNQTLLEDPLYLGLKQPRLSPKETCEFVGEFVDAYHAFFKKAILQFEDFSNDTCFDILAQNRDKYPVFNDDIQGTAAVALAGLIRALHLTKSSIKDARVVFLGAGSAAVGIAEMMRDYAMIHEGLSKEEAAKLFYLVDSKGLVADNRGDKLQAHKVSLSRKEADLPKLKTLDEVVDYVKPTALFGLSTIGASFTPALIKKMASFNKHPIIFPLSNPTSKSECTFEEALEHTEGRVLFASGSPFRPVTFNGKERIAQQANNMSIFPGLGQGCILAQVTTIPESLIHASAEALATSLNEKELAADLLFPELTRIREISVVVARQVIRAAQKEGVDTKQELRRYSDKELDDYILRSMWYPEPAESRL